MKSLKTLLWMGFCLLLSRTSFAEESLAQWMESVPTGGTLTLSAEKIYSVSKSFKTRPDIQLVVPSGARVEVRNGVTLEVRGPLQAGIYPIFFGPGHVRFNEALVAAVFPQWWGAYSDASHVLETTRALQAALDTGLKVILPVGRYKAGPLDVKSDGQIVEGVNREKSVLLFADSKGSFVQLHGSFVKLRDFAVVGEAKDSSATSTGVHFLNSTRGQLENLRIDGFGYGIQISEFGGNNISHCYLLSNRRAGIYLSGGAHGVSITNGTEIAGSPFGIVLGHFLESPWRLDQDAAGVVGQMVSVQGAVIEAIHAVGNGKCSDCMGGVGIFSNMGQKGISVTGTYFEQMKVALQLGHAFKNDGHTAHSTAVLNPTFRDNFLSNVTAAIKVGRVSYGEITNNHCSGVKTMFDTSEAGLFQLVKVETNFNCGQLTNKPFSADFGK